MIKAKIIKLPPNLDTDQIIASKYLNTIEPEVLRLHCLEGVRDGFYKEAKGAVIVAGQNFGCGSSREHAALSLKYCGIKAIIAPSFSPIFLRNSINIGLYVILLDIYNEVIDGEELFFDTKNGLIKYKERIYNFPPYPEFLEKLLEKGGLLEYARV